jgi:hypothetical protein
MNKGVYFNAKQIEFAMAPQRIKCMVAGRGFGKSTEITLILYEWLRRMPRAKVFLASTTFEQITDFTLPVIRAKWADLGLKEDVHYVVAKRPPERWETPYKKVEKYDRVITFFNGFTIVFLSSERMNARRGGSFDAGIVDEAAFVKAAAFKSVFAASIRGNIGLFPKDIHRSLVVITSRPRTIEGRWIYNFKALAEKNPDKVLYMEASALDNVDALGAEWFEDMKESMGDLEYVIEVLNQEVEELPNGFYNKYRSHIHEYRPKYDVRGKMLDIEPDELIEVSVDYSGWFNCFTVYQQDYPNNTEYLKRIFWVASDNIENLVDQFCEYFKAHRFKYVRLWGEPRMWDRTAKGYIATTIEARFKHHQWVCDVMTKSGYRTQAHKEQYQFMLKLLEEKDDALPKLRINKDACSDLIVGIKTADINADMTLNKSAEKRRDFPQQHATHLPQTVNYYLMQKHGDRLLERHAANNRPGEVEFS